MMTEQEKRQIIEEYVKENQSISFLAKKYHRKSQTISKLLKEHNIEVKLGLRQKKLSNSQQAMILTGNDNKESIKQIAKAVGVCSAVIRREMNSLNLLPNYKKVNRNMSEDFFEVIDTEEKAYQVGLLFTDGSVRKYKNSKQIRISLQAQDLEMIQKIYQILNLDCAIQEDKRIGKEMYTLEITSEKMFDDLTKLGIIPNKTYEAKQLPIINEKYYTSFLRGLFDGDGILSYKENYNDCSIGFCSYSEEIVREFQEKIDKRINKINSNKIFYGSCWRCSWRGRRQILKILSLLYDDANIYLNRKYQKYQRLLKTVADKDIV